jgi:hypothetical protein
VVYREQTTPESLSNQKKPDKAFKVSPIRPSPERKDAYVYETPESKCYNSFDEYPNSACPGAGSSNCTGVVHHIGGWDTRKIPGEQDRQSVPIWPLRDVLPSQIIHTKQRHQYSCKKKKKTIRKENLKMRGKIRTLA